MLRVLVGENDVRPGLEGACRTGGTVSWVVPKDSKIGDEVVILFNRSEFVARGEVQSSPSPIMHGQRHVYSADLGSLELLPKPVRLDVVEKRLPDWDWATYPRSFTTPSPSVAERLLEVLAVPNTQDRELAVQEGLGREATSLRYPRSEPLRQEALRRARGTCEACGQDYSLALGGRGVCVLQVHHRHQRSLDKVPRLTTSKDLAVLCANCHCIVHMNPRATMPVETLRKLIKQEP